MLEAQGTLIFPNRTEPKNLQNGLPWQCVKTVIFTPLSTFYTKLKSHTNRKSDIICSFAPHNVCQSLANKKNQKKTTPLRLTMSAKVFQNQKNQKKPKKPPQPPRSSPSHGFGFFVFVFGFFGFLEVFATFGGKPQENQKKNKKKNNPPDPLHPMGLFFLFFLVFSVFSRFLLLLVESLKKQKLFNILIITSAIQRFDSHSLNSFGKASESTNFCSHFCDSRPFTLLRNILCPCHP